MRRFRWVTFSVLAGLLVLVFQPRPTEAQPDPAGPEAGADVHSLLQIPARPSLQRCGGWQSERCDPVLEAYGTHVAHRAVAARAGGSRLPATAAAAVISDKCPREALPGATCGHVDVPLDRGDPSQGTIAIAFQLYTHADPGPAVSAILVNYGGPGAGTTPDPGSAFYLFGANLATHDLLLIDDRGRGYSDVIDCPKLQNAVGRIPKQVQECGHVVGEAIDDYGSGDVAMDTDAVRAALGYDLVDYYGVSFGGADINAYATRFPQHVRSLILDAPWGDTEIREEFPDARMFITSSLDLIRIVCERSLSCSSERSDPVGDFSSLVDHVRSKPVNGRGTSGDGSRLDVKVDVKYLVEYLLLPYGLFTGNAEIAAAAVALESGDRVPLLRLAAEGFFPQCCLKPPDPPPPPPVFFSYGAYLATFCADNTWNWNWASPVADRQAQHASAAAAIDQSVFEPFTAAEATDSNFVSSPLCVRWPDPTGSSPIAPPNAPYPNVPTLVMGGDLDNIVPLEQTRLIADLYPGSTLVEVAGAGHGAAFWSQCAGALAVEFFETLEVGNANCSEPEFQIPAVGEFPLKAADASPAEARGGNEASKAERRVATVAVDAVNDALVRAGLGFSGHGNFESRGLRGGRVEFEFRGGAGANWIITLSKVQFAQDVKVSGVIRRPPGTAITAELTVRGAGTDGGTLIVKTTKALIADFWRVAGELGGEAVDVRVPQA